MTFIVTMHIKCTQAFKPPPTEAGAEELRRNPNELKELLEAVFTACNDMTCLAKSAATKFSEKYEKLSEKFSEKYAAIKFSEKFSRSTRSPTS